MDYLKMLYQLFLKFWEAINARYGETKRYVLGRPDHRGGELINIKPGGVGTAVFDIPKEWANQYRVVVQPTSDYYTICLTDDISPNLLVKIDQSAGTITEHNTYPFLDSSFAQVNDAQVLFAPIAMVGECFPANGHRIEVTVYLDNQGAESEVRSVRVTVAPGKPEFRKHNRYYSLDVGVPLSIPVPRFAKAVKFRFYNEAGEGLEAIDSLTFQGIGFSSVASNSSLLLLSDTITFDSLGNPVFCGMTKFIDLPQKTLAIDIDHSFIQTGELVVTWELYE